MELVTTSEAAGLLGLRTDTKYTVLESKFKLLPVTTYGSKKKTYRFYDKDAVLAVVPVPTPKTEVVNKELDREIQLLVTAFNKQQDELVKLAAATKYLCERMTDVSGQLTTIEGQLNKLL